jgi:tripartite-type tricarboxylate transporter receptor subunit TctC
MTRIFGIAISLLMLAGSAAAQTYPARPITLLVSTTPGASPDLIARLFGQHLSDMFKQPVVVENRGGANGQIAVTAAVNAAPDGYTFLATTGATLAVNPALYPKTGQAVMTLAPVTRFANQDFMLTARPELGVRSLAELAAWSKKNAGKLNVATTALGSLAYLTAQLFEQTAGIEFVTVPYNGGGNALTAVLGGHADVLLETVSLSRPYIESGKLLPIAVTGPRRSAFVPNTPTLKELGVNVETSGWTAMVAPKGTPSDIIARVQAELAKAGARPDIKARLDELSAEPVLNTPEEFAREWRAEAAMWESVIQKAGIKVQ